MSETRDIMYDILMRLSLPLHEASQRQFNQALHLTNDGERCASLAAGKVLMEWATICSAVVDDIRKEREQQQQIRKADPMHTVLYGDGHGDGAMK